MISSCVYIYLYGSEWLDGNKYTARKQTIDHATTTLMCLLHQRHMLREGAWAADPRIPGTIIVNVFDISGNVFLN